MVKAGFRHLTFAVSGIKLFSKKPLYILVNTAPSADTVKWQNGM